MALVSRRGLLQGGAAAGAAAFLGLRPLSPASAAAAGAPGSPLSRSTYTALSSRDFSIGGQAMKLVSVSDLSSEPALAGADDAFSVIFSGSGKAPLEQGVRQFENSEMGRFELFVVPVDVSGDQQLYEAVVNSHVPARKPKPADPPQPGSGNGQAKPRKARKKQVVRRISVRRLRRGLSCKFTFGAAAHVKVLSAWLMRGDRAVAAGTVTRVRGRERVTLRLPTRRRLRKGSYHLVVLTEDRKGALEYKRQRLTLR